MRHIYSPLCKFNYYRQGTPIEWRYTEDGKHVRISLRTGRIIPIPFSSEETKDYKTARMYVEQPKDTPKEEVLKVTFKVCNVQNTSNL